jgi:hypothetical protein
MTEKQWHMARDVALIVGLIAAAVTFGLTGQEVLAGSALGGVLGFVTQGNKAPLAAALIGGTVVTTMGGF